MNNPKTNQGPCLFIVAAGSGGHIVPALTAAHTWQQNNPGGSVYFLTSSKLLDQKIAAHYPWIAGTKNFAPLNLPGKRLWRYPQFIWRFCTAFVGSWYYMGKCRPSEVISTGGLLSIPVFIAAWLRGARLTLYELNVIPGKATRFLASWADKLLITFEQTRSRFENQADKCTLVEYPIRFTAADREISKAEAYENINALIREGNDQKLLLNPERKTLFILGGSQGSSLLNGLVKQWVEVNAHPEVQIIHQTGNDDAFDWKAFYAQRDIPACVFSYHHQIEQCYAAADLVLCRAGAGTLFELAFFTKRSVVIPLAGHADNHQIFNAQALAEAYPHLFTIVEQHKVTHSPELLFKQLNTHL